MKPAEIPASQVGPAPASPPAERAAPPRPRPSSAPVNLCVIRDPAVVRRQQAEWAERCGVEVEWTSASGLAFRLVPPGIGYLGATESDPLAQPDEKPRVQVTVPRAMYVSRFPVTHGLVRRFLDEAVGGEDAAADRLARDRGFAGPSRQRAADPAAPAVCVSYADAEVLCDWLGRSDGKVYRVATEAEWEYAARAGSAGPWWWPDPARPPALVTGPPGPRAAGPDRANAWGLVDVLGNVWEWTASEYHPLAAKPAGAAVPARRGGSRVVRGGGWRDAPAGLRLSRRKSAHAGHRADDVGVRIVCEIAAGRERVG